jgi:multicomponent Na+:H+ antiporter subunit B
MNSVILSTATRFLVPLIVLLSVFVFFRGHNEPGGGFIGGLLAATAFALMEKAEGRRAARSGSARNPSRPSGSAAASSRGSGAGCNTAISSRASGRC